jgi:uncharacterized membrane protein
MSEKPELPLEEDVQPKVVAPSEILKSGEDKEMSNVDPKTLCLAIQAISRQSSFSGPIPPPEILKQYNEIVPGSAERLIKSAEIQAAHRQQLENKSIGSDINRSREGQILGFILSMTAVIGSLVVIGMGYAAAGAAIIISTLVALVSVFVVGKEKQASERTRKEKRLKKIQQGRNLDKQESPQLPTKNSDLSAS